MSTSKYSVLFLVDGAAGIGKTDLIQYWHGQAKCTLIKKFAYISENAPPDRRNWRQKKGLIKADAQAYRQACGDRSGTIIYSSKQKERHWFEHYWVRLSEIQEALDQDPESRACMICRDFKAIERIRALLPYTRVVSILVYVNPMAVARDRNTRNRNKEIEQIALENITRYDDVLICPGNRAWSYKGQLDRVLNKYGRLTHGQICLNSNNLISMPDHLVSAAPNAQRALEKYPFDKNVFVMMPYRADTEEYERRINKALSNHDLNPVYAKYPEWNLTDHADNSRAVLICCKYGIALFAPDPGENIKLEPREYLNLNVMYELGCMHTLGRTCVGLAEVALKEKVPHDLRGRHWRYFKDAGAVEDIVEVWCSGLEGI
jgi:hypothetical protein